MWIKSARERGSRACPINDDDVNGQTPLHSGGSLPMTRLIFHLNGGVLNLIVILR